MSLSRLRSWVHVIIVVLAFAGTGTSVSAMPILTPSGLNPGDTYQLAFVTSTTRDATSSDIAVYNAFVQAAADAAGIGIGGSLGDVTWSAIASTPTVDARDNALVVGPVYNLGDQNIALSFLDMWDGALFAPVAFDETGGFVVTGAVWTGTIHNGLGSTDSELGSIFGPSVAGLIGTSGSTWVLEQFRDQSFGESFYALSELLTVPAAAVPEPATLMLFGSGLVGLLAWRSRRRGQE